MPAHRHAERRARLRALLAEEGLPALLVTDLCNVRYLTGFSGSNAVLLLGQDPDLDLLGTDGRYVDQVAAEAGDLPLVIDRDTLTAVLAARPGASLAVEDQLTVAQASRIREQHGEPAVASGLVERMRATKDDDELAALERACAVTVSAMAALADEMTVGVSERSLARRLEQLFGDLGADDRAFETIVGSGPNAAIPHHQPGDRRLAPGDLVVVDAGALVDGYHADMTRTFVVGEATDAWQREVHACVAAAQRAATEAYMPGASARDVDAVARAVVEAAGLADRFTHGLGHGVGLQIHEAPMVGSRATGTLGAHMAVTVEPGVYLAGQGGVRIEDTLVVTDAGPRILTEAPRDLRPVG